LEEKEGFEPSVPCDTPDFESGTFDHSATSPDSCRSKRIRDSIRLKQAGFSLEYRRFTRMGD
jgi:hypothetical protein